MTSQQTQSKINIMVLDDEELVRNNWLDSLDGEFGSLLEPQTADSFDRVQELWEEGFRPQLAVIDHRLVDSDQDEAANGCEVVRWLNGKSPKTQFVVQTGFDTEMTKSGSPVYEEYNSIVPGIKVFSKKDDDYIAKMMPHIGEIIDSLQGKLPDSTLVLFKEFIAESPGMQRFLLLLAPHVRHRSALLFSGQSGVGKKYAANAVHRISTSSEGSKVPTLEFNRSEYAEEALAEKFSDMLKAPGPAAQGKSVGWLNLYKATAMCWRK